MLFLIRKQKIEEKKYYTNLWSEYLAVIPLTGEENVAIAIHCVSCSNYAVHPQRPVQARIIFYICDFHGVYLQSVIDQSTAWAVSQCTVCKVHRTQ
jgi:hypothetical protein